MGNRVVASIAALLLLSSPTYADSYGSAVGGAAANQSSMAGGLCLTSPAALTTGQQAGVVIDCTTHALLTIPSSSGIQPITPSAVTPTDRGGTITLGGTAQTLAASNTSRKFLLVLNPCTATGQGIATAEDIFISVTGSATVNGASNYADIPPCGSAAISYNGVVITAAVTINAATTSHRWSATEAQ